LEASTLKYGCPFKEDKTWLTFNDTSQWLSNYDNKMGQAAAGSWSFPMLWELTESCIREATGSGIQ